MKLYDLLNSAYSDTIRNGGFTATFEGTPRDTVAPYVVGNGNKGFKMETSRFYTTQGRTEFIAICESKVPEWKGSGFDGFGTWIDGGTVYVDPIEVFCDLLPALQRGRQNGEMAIFNRSTQTVVTV